MAAFVGVCGRARCHCGSRLDLRRARRRAVLQGQAAHPSHQFRAPAARPTSKAGCLPNTSSRHIAGHPNVAGAEHGRRRRRRRRQISRRSRRRRTAPWWAISPAPLSSTRSTRRASAPTSGPTISSPSRAAPRSIIVRTDVPPGMKDATDIVKAKGLIGGGLSVGYRRRICRMRLGLDMLGVPYKYVTGYRSSPAARLALSERRDQYVFGIAAELSQRRRAGPGRRPARRSRSGMTPILTAVTSARLRRWKSCDPAVPRALPEDQRRAAVGDAVGQLPGDRRVGRHDAAHDLLAARHAAGRARGVERRHRRAQCRPGLCRRRHDARSASCRNGEAGPRDRQDHPVGAWRCRTTVRTFITDLHQGGEQDSLSPHAGRGSG